MTPEQEIENALGASTDCLRLAAQSLRINGRPVLADMLSEQADKNIILLLPWTRK